MTLYFLRKGLTNCSSQIDFTESHTDLKPFYPIGVHVAAHLVNALNFSVNYNKEFPELNAATHQDEVGGLHFLTLLSLVMK